VKPADQFHVGIVVDDLDAGLDELGALLGHDWGPEVDVEQRVRMPDGAATVRFRFRYSRSTPRLEVIQAQPGTVWAPAAGSGIHHLGWWSDDVIGDGERLEAAGYALEAAGEDEHGTRSWAYHRGPTGPRVELVSRELASAMTALWA
jgi:Glyoxalase/Bleomycin resistance protein/Dioxygenase superfamily